MYEWKPPFFDVLREDNFELECWMWGYEAKELPRLVRNVVRWAQDAPCQVGFSTNTNGHNQIRVWFNRVAVKNPLIYRLDIQYVLLARLLREFSCSVVVGTRRYMLDHDGQVARIIEVDDGGC